MNNKLKLLIVDQSPLVSPHIKNLLSDMEDEIIIGEARNRIEASELLQLVVPDVMLLDLPQRDGINLIAEIKTKYPSVKVIVFTNYTERFYMSTCFEKGADHFIEKAMEFNLIPVILSEMINDVQYEPFRAR